MTSPRTLRYLARVALFTLILGTCWLEPAAACPASDSSCTTVVPNDNRRPAGSLRDGTLTLALRAGTGTWYPEGPSGPPLQVEAFGEEDAPLTVPAPLIRVIEGTQIVASIRNDLDAPLTVHGLCARDGGTCPPLQVPPRQAREVRFIGGRAGTYHYWASTMGAPVPFRELSGAFIVDPAEGAIEPDRILVITEWGNLTREQLGAIISADDPTAEFVKAKPRFTFVLNGLSWPATERFTYRVGEHVRWRVINLSSQVHPMHLHGFYFDVESLGNGMRDAQVDASKPHRVVTQMLPSGGTMAMTWTPEREGNWLFHCHILHHVSMSRRLGPSDHDHHHGDANGSAGMAGMVIGITVLGPPAAPSRPSSATARKLTLVIEPRPSGPPIVLGRGEPVEITLVNKLSEATSIHWHGIELDSYYDGVHGWSGIGERRAPMIEPGGTFVVRFTPPRAGTFIYHTHLHDVRQLSSGLYGPIIVTEPGETFDPTTDHVIVLGRSGLTSEEEAILGSPESTVMNGVRAPRFVWKAGERHRVRVINITPDDIFSVTLQTKGAPSLWKLVSKDGVPLPADAKDVPAVQTIAVGETYEFEWQAPPGRNTAWLEVRSTGGRWHVQGEIVVK
jgi:FtsP/CotA-like multicopper oxidase with cupredoxin domain